MPFKANCIYFEHGGCINSNRKYFFGIFQNHNCIMINGNKCKYQKKHKCPDIKRESLINDIVFIIDEDVLNYEYHREIVIPEPLFIPGVTYIDTSGQREIMLHLFKHKESNKFFRVGYSITTKNVYICIPNDGFMTDNISKVVAQEYVSNLKSGFFIPGKPPKRL